eukprot:6032075-Amphidinium_carterae.1
MALQKSVWNTILSGGKDAGSFEALTARPVAGQMTGMAKRRRLGQDTMPGRCVAWNATACGFSIVIFNLYPFAYTAKRVATRPFKDCFIAS